MQEHYGCYNFYLELYIDRKIFTPIEYKKLKLFVSERGLRTAQANSLVRTEYHLLLKTRIREGCSFLSFT